MEFELTGLKRISVPTPSYSIYIERSESPHVTDSWTLVNPTGCDEFYYIDDLPFLMNFTRKPYYRAYFNQGSEKIYSEVETIGRDLPRHLFLVKRKILHDELLVLKKLTGVKIAVIKRRHWGEHCSTCYDPNTGRTTRTHCPECLGTGYKNPYHQPFLTYGKRLPEVENINLTRDNAVGSDDYTKMQLLDFPSLTPQDIIIDLAVNDRYKVEKVEPTELQRVVVHQEVIISKLARTAPEYKILIPNNLVDISDQISL